MPLQQVDVKPVGADPLADLWKGLFGGQEVQQLSRLTPEQQELLNQNIGLASGAMGGLYSALGQGAAVPTSAYEALPDFEGQFQQQFGQPLQQQYEANLRQISNTPELFSGGTKANEFRALNQFNTGLASARANMMMQERNKQMASMENALGRQQRAQQMLSSLTARPFGVNATENVVSQDTGLIGDLTQVAGLGTLAGSALGGLGLTGGGGMPYQGGQSMAGLANTALLAGMLNK